VLPLITKYLIQYRKVSIPNVGSFEIKYRSSELDVADKKILSPVFSTEYSPSDQVSQHQLHYFASTLRSSKEMAGTDLLRFGTQLTQKLSEGAFRWNGLGTLKNTDKEIVFEPEDIRPVGFDAIPASRVIREKSDHMVLVGEQERSSIEMTESLQPSGKPTRSYLNLIGWIILLLVVAVIVFILFRNGFSPLGAGLR
jgi:hypothetical protein